MKKIVLQKSGLYTAGRILQIIGYIESMVVLFIFSIACFVFSGNWQTIPEIANEIPPEVFDIMTGVFVGYGVFMVGMLILIAILGGIAIEKVKNAETKQELIPWAVVTLIFCSTASGVLLLCSRQKEVDDVVVE